MLICLRSDIQERYRSAKVTYQEREAETAQAMHILGLEWKQLPVLDTAPYEERMEQVEVYLNGYNADPFAEHFGDLHVFAPAWEEHGHEDHNGIAELADRVFGAGNVTHYMTYQTGTGHSQSENEVDYEPEWIALKLRALACYESQMREPSTRDWFGPLLEVREWIQ